MWTVNPQQQSHRIEESNSKRASLKVKLPTVTRAVRVRRTLNCNEENGDNDRDEEGDIDRESNLPLTLWLKEELHHYLQRCCRFNVRLTTLMSWSSVRLWIF